MMKRFASFLIRLIVWIYRRFFRPLIWAINGGQGCCRYSPTCSQYMLDAVVLYGPWKGTYLGLRRILRCHPWGGHGYDPVTPLKKLQTDETDSVSTEKSEQDDEVNPDYKAKCGCRDELS